MNHQILAEHKCKGKCPEFKTEQCNHCLISSCSEIPNSSTDNMESCYIEKKQQVELLQTEVARLNHKCERQAAEMLAMQAEIDLLKAARETERAIEEEIDAVVCLRSDV